MANDLYHKISDGIIYLHEVAREVEDSDVSLRIRLLADALAKLGNEIHDRDQEKLSN